MYSIDDDIKHVSKGALQHMGENMLAIVKGVASEANFPGRMQQKEGAFSSGLFYFTIIGGYVFSISSKTASIIFPITAAAMMMVMPYYFTSQRLGTQVGLLEQVLEQNGCTSSLQFKNICFNSTSLLFLSSSVYWILK